MSETDVPSRRSPFERIPSFSGPPLFGVLVWVAVILVVLHLPPWQSRGQVAVAGWPAVWWQCGYGFSDHRGDFSVTSPVVLWYNVAFAAALGILVTLAHRWAAGKRLTITGMLALTLAAALLLAVFPAIDDWRRFSLGSLYLSLWLLLGGTLWTIYGISQSRIG